MTLLNLIRKPISREAATAISAISATRPAHRAATVARTANVAVANPTKAKTDTSACTLLTSVTDPSDLISDYAECIAICLKTGDVAEDDAHRIASEQCGATQDELAARQVSYWCQRIESLPEPADHRLSKIRYIALEFLALPWMLQAATLRWTAPELFGLHRVAANVRIEAMGLVPSLALSKLRPPFQVSSITATVATVVTGSGATLTHRRLRPNLGSPVWEHPAFERVTRQSRKTRS